jgi:polysaccharide export outer membrane protein
MKFSSGAPSIALFAAVLAGCSSLGASGPSRGTVVGASERPVGQAPIKILDLTDEVARRVAASNRSLLLSETLGDGQGVDTSVGYGDVLDVSIWEAPPATLFGGGSAAARLGLTTTGGQNAIPEQMVDSAGQINIPFAGSIPVAGRTTQQIERDIERRLTGIAHQPQVVVRLVRNSSANVTVVGDVTNSARVPLTAKGERLLDVLASAGGVKQPVGKMTIQITRGARVAALPLEAIIKDPRQNIRLQADDVVTALFQPYSFTALGAVKNNAEINFEATGLTLSQALGRIGGLEDARADVKGVFIFRFEDPAALDPALVAGAQTTPDGKIPVIYKINMKDPATYFAAQGFPIENKDVIYVSNAPLADLQKFVNVVSSWAFSVVGLGNAVR